MIRHLIGQARGQLLGRRHLDGRCWDRQLTSIQTTFSGHLRADLIRMVILSMISGRSGKLAGGSGKGQPAIKRRTASALPTTTKYLALGTADSSRDLSNLGQPMTAMLDHTHVAANQLATPPLIEPLSPLGAWNENYWLAIKSAQAASIRKRHVA